jgi:hypothetical protein
VAVSGCDFFRKVAGRPTSADIQEKKILIERHEEEKLALEMEQERIRVEKARLDSIAEVEHLRTLAEETVRKDSLNALDQLSNEKVLMYPLSTFKGLSSGEISHRYHIILGSFKEESNADKLIRQIMDKSDFEPVKLSFLNNRTAVGVCPSNKLTEIVDVIDDVRACPFCPKDAWILVNE